MVASEHADTPMHSIKVNARYVARPKTLYHELSYIARHFPQWFAELEAKRRTWSRRSTLSPR